MFSSLADVAAAARQVVYRQSSAHDKDIEINLARFFYLETKKQYAHLLLERNHLFQHRCQSRAIINNEILKRVPCGIVDLKKKMNRPKQIKGNERKKTTFLIKMIFIFNIRADVCASLKFHDVSMSCYISHEPTTRKIRWQVIKLVVWLVENEKCRDAHWSSLRSNLLTWIFVGFVATKFTPTKNKGHI